MAKKVLIAIVVIAAVSVFLTIREQGVEHAFGGIFAPLETVRDASLAEDHFDAVSPTSHSFAAGQSDGSYRQLSNRVRDRVNNAMRRSVERSSRH